LPKIDPKLLSDRGAALDAAADVLAQADALLVTAGAGLGVDSGLPDFRGPAGFWRAYPALGRRGLHFYEVANPRTFEREPLLAWGFYGHRLDLYRRTSPHAGFTMLRDWGQRMLHGAATFTSNIDGHFQRAGFAADSVTECHGSIHHLQCTRPCSNDIWSAEGFVPVVDNDACRLLSEPPRCPRCGALARPNILMFGDDEWVNERAAMQQARIERWLATVQRLAIVELGAGTDIASVRDFSHQAIIEHEAVLIRINPRHPYVPGSMHVAIAAPALETLIQIQKRLDQK
jgi:NAD-dependent SIR2 family protein deacetylase